MSEPRTQPLTGKLLAKVATTHELVWADYRAAIKTCLAAARLGSFSVPLVFDEIRHLAVRQLLAEEGIATVVDRDLEAPPPGCVIFAAYWIYTKDERDPAPDMVQGLRKIGSSK